MSMSSTTRAGVITAAVLGSTLFVLLAAFAIFWWKGRGMVDRRRAARSARRDAERQVDTVTPYQFPAAASAVVAGPSRGHAASPSAAPAHVPSTHTHRPPSAHSCAVHDECSAAIARAKDANTTPNRFAVGKGSARPSPAPPSMRGASPLPSAAVGLRRELPEVHVATPGAALDLALAGEGAAQTDVPAHTAAAASTAGATATATAGRTHVRPPGPTRGYAYTTTSQRLHQRTLSDESGGSHGAGGGGGHGLGLDLAVPYDVQVIPPPPRGVPGSPSPTASLCGGGGGGLYMEWAPSRPASALGTPPKQPPLSLPAITTSRHPGAAQAQSESESRSSSMSSSSRSLSMSLSPTPTPVTPTAGGGGLGRVPSAQSMAGLSSRDKMLALYEASHHSHAAAGTHLQSQSVRSLPLSP